MIGGRILDASAVRDITIGRTVYGAAFLAAANDLAIALVVPAAALQEAWAQAEEQDHPFLELLLDLPLTIIDPLDAAAAADSGVLAHAAHVGGRWQAGAAQATLSARARGWPVLTADPDALRAIDPTLPLEILPGD